MPIAKEKVAPVMVSMMRLIVENTSRRKKPLSQKPICHPSQSYKRLSAVMFETPIIMGWMPYEAKRKSANPIGGMYSRNEF